MPEIKDFVDLPWPALLTIACGYVAYWVSNVGLREHHKSIDIAFSTLAFGTICGGCYALLLGQWRVPDAIASLTTFVIATVLGIFWSAAGRKLVRKLLRWGDVSHADELPSALASLYSVTNVSTHQLSVKLTDGTWLMCDDLSRFKSEPNGPCVLGNEGDVLMYVTHQLKVGATEYEPCDDVVHAEWGAEITYIPADRIERFYLRRRSR